jgi:uncharacterized repeat protein (TIGR01451 family)
MIPRIPCKFGGVVFVFHLSALLATVASFSVEGVAQQITTTTLTVVATPNPPTLSDPVTLTATVSPPPAAGKVTFYDGTTILGVSGVTAGNATLVTRLLPPGTRSLQARYWGDASFNASTSDVLRQTVTAKQGFGFSPAIGSPFAVARAPQFLAVGDFNGDGKPDLVAPSQAGAGVTVLLNNRSGGLAPAPGGIFAKGISALAIAVADFDGDGKLDLAVPDRQNSNITIWLGDGAGGFLAPVGSFATGSIPWGLTVGDFNGDGKPDLAVANIGSDSVTVLLGDGAGGFLSPGRIFAVAKQPLGVTTGDFNGDGKPDLAVTNSGDNSVTVLLGDGSGGFTRATGQPPSTESFPAFLVVGDFDGDGNQDLAVANSANSSNSVTVLLGDGSGGFVPAQGSPFEVGFSPFSLAVGDFNGDGKPDLAVANSVSNSVTVLLGNGNGGFTPALQSPIPVGASPSGVVVGDFDGDGRLDLAVANYGDNNLSLLLANIGLRITQSQATAFLANQTGVYALTVTNDRGESVTGEVTVLDVLPPGLTPTTGTGTGWSCEIDGQNVTCTRSDELGAGQNYPPINLTVKVGGSACPGASNVVRVSLNHETSVTDSHSTSILDCLTITQRHVGQFIVSQTGTYALTVERANGAVIQSGIKVTVIDVVPAGLTPIAGTGSGWSCPIAGQNVTCTWSGDLTGGPEYPPINLVVNVAATACPSVINVAEVFIDESHQAFSNPDSVDASGCLVIQPSGIDFQNVKIVPPGQSGGKAFALMVSSFDKNRLKLTATAGPGRFLAIPNFDSCNLSPGDPPCTIGVGFVPACLGEQLDKLTIRTDVGATYDVSLRGVGVPNAVSFVGPPDSVTPGEQYTVGLKLDPVPDPACGQNPAVALSFSPPAPDGTNFDVRFDPNTSVLQAGTVAGTITLQAQLDGKSFTAADGSGARTLQLPSQPGVIRNVSINQRTQSSFQIGVTGFSTPRETGANATTEVCLGFLPASGASVEASAQLCALKEDIRIWYERITSYPTGSQFHASVTVSFSGDINAIGGLKVVLKNKEGDSQPYCVDFKSGNKLDKCP